MIVEWSEEAAAQLQSVRDFLARTSPAYAQLVAERIVQWTEQLADHPLIGASVPEYADDTIREVFSHPYRIIYLVEKERVVVVAVIHAARQMPRLAPG